VPDCVESLLPHRLILAQLRWGSFSCPGPAGLPVLSTHTSPALFDEAKAVSTGECSMAAPAAIVPAARTAGAVLRMSSVSMGCLLVWMHRLCRSHRAILPNIHVQGAEAGAPVCPS